MTFFGATEDGVDATLAGYPLRRRAHLLAVEVSLHCADVLRVLPAYHPIVEARPDEQAQPRQVDHLHHDLPAEHLLQAVVLDLQLDGEIRDLRGPRLLHVDLADAIGDLMLRDRCIQLRPPLKGPVVFYSLPLRERAPPEVVRLNKELPGRISGVGHSESVSKRPI